jgi:ribosomal protein L11 methylase PrmA
MKSLLLQIVRTLLNLKSFRKIIQKLSWEKEKYEAKIISKEISPGSIVLRGPFKGMKYASLDAGGSRLLTKILGSYEDELHEIIYSIVNNDYTEIIDVGCAEGYYAVGLALKMRNCKIHAYDTDKRAIEFCKEMAKKNNVVEKFSFGDFCSAQTLANFKFSGKAFIISDCEGYEVELFAKENAGNLKNCDILIEVHNLIHPDARKYLEDLFKDTHVTRIIKSRLKQVDDYEELKSIDKEYYNDIILTERDARMEWLFLKTNNQ